jgi:transposase
MKQTSGPAKKPADTVIKDIRRATRRQFSSEEKIRVVLEGLRGEDSIAELCRREGIAASMYYGWSKEFLEAGKKRLSGDTSRAATTDEVRDLRREAGALKEVVADLVLENRLLKKRMARPVCKVVDEDACDRSAQTYPACRHGGRRQDGEPHVPGLISNSASGAAFFARLPERRSTVRPSSLSSRRPRGPAPSDRAPPQVNLF